MTEKINKGFSDKYGVDLAFSVSQILPMPVHEESDRTLAYSAFVRFEMNDEFGNLTPNLFVVTATVAQARDKLLLLFVYAEESGLEWNKETSRQWANSIGAANPSDAKTGAKVDALPASHQRGHLLGVVDSRPRHPSPRCNAGQLRDFANAVAVGCGSPQAVPYCSKTLMHCRSP